MPRCCSTATASTSNLSVSSLHGVSLLHVSDGLWPGDEITHRPRMWFNSCRNEPHGNRAALCEVHSGVRTRLRVGILLPTPSPPHRSPLTSLAAAEFLCYYAGVPPASCPCHDVRAPLTCHHPACHRDVVHSRKPVDEVVMLASASFHLQYRIVSVTVRIASDTLEPRLRLRIMSDTLADAIVLLLRLA